jgi:hypothetical protein
LRALVILASLLLNIWAAGTVIADEFTALESRIDSQLYELLADKLDTDKSKIIKDLVETKMSIENIRIARINIQISEPRVLNSYNRMKTPVVELEAIAVEQRKQAEASAARQKEAIEARKKAGLPVSRPGTPEAANGFRMESNR